MCGATPTFLVQNFPGATKYAKGHAKGRYKEYENQAENLDAETSVGKKHNEKGEESGKISLQAADRERLAWTQSRG